MPHACAACMGPGMECVACDESIWETRNTRVVGGVGPSGRSAYGQGMPDKGHIYAKLLATAEMEVKYKPKVFVSQIWNAIIISMYRDHLLSIDNVQRLLYHQTDGPDGRRAPPFFVNNDGAGFSNNFFAAGSEA